MTYLIHLFVLFGVFTLLALSLNLTVGRLGLVSISQAVFFAFGAYGTAILVSCGLDGIAVMLAVACIGGVSGAIVSLVLLRLKDDYFAIASFTIQAIVVSCLFNLRDLTGGASGFSGVAPFRLLGVELVGPYPFAAIIWVLIGFTVVFSIALKRSPAGLLCTALQQD